jgi:hypothetical protein
MISDITNEHKKLKKTTQQTKRKSLGSKGCIAAVSSHCVMMENKGGSVFWVVRVLFLKGYRGCALLVVGLSSEFLMRMSGGFVFHELRVLLALYVVQ